MEQRKSRLLPLGIGAGLIVLILDSQHSAEFAWEGLELCLKTVIPSLFPLFVLSGWLLSFPVQEGNGVTRMAESLLSLPPGRGRLFLLGAVGGFPLGAQCIVQGMNQGLTREDGEDMLGYCNNCGPGFLFGILPKLFSDAKLPGVLFLIQLEAAVAVCLLWPRHGPSKPMGTPTESQAPSLTQAISRAAASMTSVCAWVILGTVVVGFFRRWFVPLLPEAMGYVLTGMIELTTGVLNLQQLASPSMRFVLCAGFICFGGICVLMQISALCAPQGLSMATCIKQKLLQGGLGVVLAVGYLRFRFPMLILVPVGVIFRKIAVAFSKQTVYNTSYKGGIDHAIPKKDGTIL